MCVCVFAHLRPPDAVTQDCTQPFSSNGSCKPIDEYSPALRAHAATGIRLVSLLSTGPPVLLLTASLPPEWGPRTQFWLWLMQVSTNMYCYYFSEFLLYCSRAVRSHSMGCDMETVSEIKRMSLSGGTEEATSVLWPSASHP